MILGGLVVVVVVVVGNFKLLRKQADQMLRGAEMKGREFLVSTCLL